jgi:peptidyl-prolyl cis-trans isomerase SurA
MNHPAGTRVALRFQHMSGLKLASGKNRRHPVGFVCVLLATGAVASCSKSPTPAAPAAAVSADTWAVVDGRNISREMVEKSYARMRDTSQTLSEEETLTAKLTLLNDIIVQEILLAKAAALKIELPETDLDTAFAEAKKSIPDESFQQELSRRNITAADMREGLRRELLTQKVMDSEVGSKITVTDQEVSDFFNANRAQFNVAEEAYHLAQIVVTPVREPQRSNRTGDDAATPQAAAAKVGMIMERLKAGASFRDVAMDFSEDADSASRGGDLGFVPTSRLKQAPPQMRDAVLNKEPGSVTVLNSGGGHTIVLVVAREAAGQRDLSMPQVKERITQTLRERREQLLRAAYLTAAQTDANIVNYLARQLIEKQAKMPSLAPSKPGAK